jgi:hypothetical protein
MTTNTLESALVQATTIAQCLAEATAYQTDKGPQTPWVHLFIHWVHEIDNAAQQLIEEVNLKCIPLMEDMQSVTRRG